MSETPYEFRLLIIGLDNSGKTTLIENLKVNTTN